MIMSIVNNRWNYKKVVPVNLIKKQLIFQQLKSDLTYP